jgi:adenosylmethionine-8-amino-7-oxononanoate aminotransferase
VPRVPAPYAYRCECRGESSLCEVCSGTALETALRDEGPETVAAFIAEPVGGSSTGASVPRSTYWQRVREICDRHEVLWIADEILTGAGRTGTWSALEPYNALPDLITLGKGITGGYLPLSAVLAPRRITDVLAQGSGALMHAQTFSHNPMGCTAGLAALDYIDRHDLLTRAAARGKELNQRLQALYRFPMVGDIRGRGLLAGIELVADRDSRKPVPRAQRLAERLAETALSEGLVVWPNTGHANGIDGDLVMLAPPFVISERELDQIVERLGAALERMADTPAPIGAG